MLNRYYDSLQYEHKLHMLCRSHEVPALLARCKEVESRAPQSQKRSDSLSSLLHCLAKCYKLHPGLWLNEDIK